MELISDTTKSIVYKNNNKVYKFTRGHKNKNIHKEVNFQYKLKNNNIPNIIDFTLTDTTIRMIEMDYKPYNIEKYFAGKYDFNLTIDQTNDLIFKVISTLKDMHDNNLSHGDFKAKNMMLDENFKLFIIDFDLSDDLNDNNKESDLRKLNLLIYQLLFKVEYKPKMYNNYKKIMNDIKIKHPELNEHMIKCDLVNMLKYFKNKN